jgi:hypothetical protein
MTTTNNWSLETCGDCSNPYCRPTAETYKKLCLPCFKKRQGWKLNQSDEALVVLQKALRMYRKKKALVKTYMVGEHLPLRDLMILCHPDKHNGSKKSTQTFQKLVDLKDKK